MRRLPKSQCGAIEPRTYHVNQHRTPAFGILVHLLQHLQVFLEVVGSGKLDGTNLLECFSRQRRSEVRKFVHIRELMILMNEALERITVRDPFLQFAAECWEPYLR